MVIKNWRFQCTILLIQYWTWHVLIKNLTTFQPFLKLFCMKTIYRSDSQCFRICNVDENMNVNSLERFFAVTQKCSGGKFITSQYPLHISKICSTSTVFAAFSRPSLFRSLVCIASELEKTRSIDAELAGRNFS